MTTLIVTLGCFAVSHAIAGIVWGVRLEGRSDANKELVGQRFADLKELIDAKFDGVDQRLHRIERALNGSLHRH